MGRRTHDFKIEEKSIMDLNKHEITYMVGIRRLMVKYQQITAPAGNPDATAAIRTLLEIKQNIDAALAYWWDKHSQEIHSAQK